MDIKVFANLRDIVGGKSIDLQPDSEMRADQLLREIVALHPGLQVKFFAPDGSLQTGIHVLVNGRDLRDLSGLDTIISPEATIRIFPPVGGGTSTVFPAQ